MARVSTAAVGLIIGHDLDDSAAPPTPERNRYVADMVLHYACEPFFSDSEDMAAVREACAADAAAVAAAADCGSMKAANLPTPLVPSLVSPSQRGRIAAAVAAALAPEARLRRRLAAQTSATLPVAACGGAGSRADDTPPSVQLERVLSIWDPLQPPSDVVEWCAQRIPPVSLAELCEFHDRDYVRYLMSREKLSGPDERAMRVKRPRAGSRESVTSWQTLDAGPLLAPVAAPAERLALSPVERVRDVVDVCNSGGSCGGGGEGPMSYQPSCPPPLRALPELTPFPQDHPFGLVQDAAPFLGLWRTVQATVAGTLSAVRWVQGAGEGDDGGEDKKESKLGAGGRCGWSERFAALHWFGGRHHARCDRAGGFCYANDVVLAAQELRRGLPLNRNRLLIVDLDAHHGDGTQDAFLFDSGCYTLSVHGYGTGFYPGSGAAGECGRGLAEGYCANVPLPEGSADSLFVPLARSAIRAAVRKLTGEAAVPSTSSPSGLGGVLLVCGSDGVRGDPIGRMNYSIAGLQSVVRLLIETAVEHDAKLLVLGAGGYVNATAARVAGVVTRDVLSAAMARRLRMPMKDLFFLSPSLNDSHSVAVPETCEYFSHYGPSFLMHGVPDACVPPVEELAPGEAGYRLWRAAVDRVESSATAALAST